MRDWRHNNNVHYFGSCGAYDVHLANLYFHAIYVVYVGDMGGFGMMLNVTVSLSMCRRTILLCHILSFKKRIFSFGLFFAIIPMSYPRDQRVYKAKIEIRISYGIIGGLLE